MIGKSVAMGIFILFFATGTQLMAQEEAVPLPKSLQPYKPRKEGDNGERKYKFLVGGGFGLELGRYTAIELYPQAGIYPVVDWLLLGVNATYMFAYDATYKYNSHVFGGGFFVEGYPVKWLTLHAGYEYMNYPLIEYNTASGVVKTMQRIGTHAIMVGPGYRQYIGEKVSMYLLVLFNLYQTSTSIYTGYIPAFRVGINVDLPSR